MCEGKDATYSLRLTICGAFYLRKAIMAYLTVIQLSILSLVVAAAQDNATYTIEYLIENYQFESVMIEDLVVRGLIYKDGLMTYTGRTKIRPTTKGTGLINSLLMHTLGR